MFDLGKNYGNANQINNPNSIRLNHFQSKLKFKFNPKDPHRATLSKSP